MNLHGRRVLVLDGESRSALAVTRSLGRSGAAVVAGTATSHNLAAASKYALRAVRYASPESDQPRFIEDLQSLCREHRITDLLPLSEIALGTILRHRERFAEVSLPYVNRETYELAVDKHRLAQIAVSLGLHAPASIYCAGAAHIDEIVGEIVYPAVLKPVKSRVEDGGTWLVTQVQYARDEAELRSRLASHPQYRFPFMVQQFIEGEGKGVFFLYDRGRELARFSHRRIREKPPTGGVSVLSVSERASDVLFADAAKLLDHLSWHGVAMVEFKVTAQGVPYLMEINPRFWGSLQLAIDAGVDFPSMLLAMSNQQIEPKREFREGVRLRWLLGDLDRLIITMKSPAWSPAQKLQSLAAFCNVFPLGTRYETGRFGDMGPFLAELRHYVASLRRTGR